MVRFDKSTVSFFGILAVTFAAAACGGPAEPTADTEATLSTHAKGDRAWWEKERARRQAEIDAYVAAHRADFDSFRKTPAGNAGVPMIMFRLLPELFPEIWGGPEANFASVGLASDPWEPGRALPLGLGFAPLEPPIPTPAGEVRMNGVQVTCMSCHSGRVEVAGAGMKPVVGAPNGEFMFQLYRRLLVATVLQPGYVPERFVEALSRKNKEAPGWIYQDPQLLAQEQLESAIFSANAGAFLARVREGAIAGATRIAQTLLAFPYARPDAPDYSGQNPGSMDAISGFAALAVDPAGFSTPEALRAVLPPAPAFCDFMPVWRQADRSAAKWGNDVLDHTSANAAAAMGMIGTPFLVNMDAVNAATRFSRDLPAAPYPFEVERAAVVRGRSLYKQYCADCHAAGNSNIKTPSEVGTDANRAAVLTPYSTAALRALIRIACDDPATCTNDGAPRPDEEILRITGGYAAVPLAGIWARAPYLHNGSVPTLRALLTNQRPERFFRGNTAYDTRDVGFEWKTAAGPNAREYDTKLAGNSNTGHSSLEYNGIDWSTQPKALDDLLEFMKTL